MSPAGRSSRSCRRPGCRRSRSSPPIAVRNPWATASPRPTPPGRLSPSRWNGWNTRSRSARASRARGRRRGSRHASASSAASTRTRAPSALNVIALSTTLAIARSSSAGSARTSGSDSGTSTSTIAPRWPRLEHGGEDDLLWRRRRPRRLDHAGLHPAHVEQVADQRRSADRFRRRSWSTNSAVSSLGPRDVAVACRLVAHALIDASGVRRSCDTACSRAPRSSLASARACARPASTRSRPCSSTGGQLIGEGVEDRARPRRRCSARRGRARCRRSAP